MPKRYIENDTASPLFVGGSMILPGTGREVDVPDHLVPVADTKPPPEDAANDKPEWPPELIALQALSISKIKAQMAELPDDQLAVLVQIEEASETPRSSLLAEIAAQQLKRAQARAGGEPS